VISKGVMQMRSKAFLFPLLLVFACFFLFSSCSSGENPNQAGIFLLFPANDQDQTDLHPEFRWQSNGLGSPTRNDRYYALYVAPLGQAFGEQVQTVQQRAFWSERLLPGLDYHWKVSFFSGGSLSVSSGEGTFSTRDYYTLEVSADPSQGGQVKQEGGNWESVLLLQVPPGTPSTLHALPSENFRFDGWFHDEEFLGDENPFSFLPGTLLHSTRAEEADVQVQACFSAGLCTVTIQASPCEQGQVRFDEDPWCDATSVTLAAGAPVALEALPEEGFLFSGWYEEGTSGVRGELVSEENPYLLTTQGDRNIWASFEVDDWITHDGDLVIEEGEEMVLEGVKYRQLGNVYIENGACLLLKDSEFILGSGAVPTVHTYFFVQEGGSFDIENSLLYTTPEYDNLVCIMNWGDMNIIDSPTSIHMLDMGEGSTLNMVNSSMIFEIGGLLQITGGESHLVNSTIASLGLWVPAAASLDIDGWESGGYFEYFDIKDLIPQANYGLIMENTRVLADDFSGELEHGPYERGWIFYIEEDAQVEIRDSHLRKVFIYDISEETTFENLRVSVPSSLHYKDIFLNDVVVKGQWPLKTDSASVTVINSNYLFFQPSGVSTVTFVDSHICEFIPRDFFGTIHFENGLWNTAGEIIGGVEGHSLANDFRITGSLEIEESVRENIRWHQAWVTREFELFVLDGEGNPIPNALVKVGETETLTDATGQAIFEIRFDENSFEQLHPVEIWSQGILLNQTDVDFFTQTPVWVQ